jgi:phage baseplate assembly protein V
MYRIGIVSEQDSTGARVRVRFPDRDEMQSYWLRIVVPKTHADKFFWMPDVGEQVVCAMDEWDEAGAVLGSIYSNLDSTPVQSPDKFNLTFRDGTVIEYDRSAHALTINLCAGASAAMNVPAGITISSGSTNVVIGPSGVSITPPLPISSTVAQT